MGAEHGSLEINSQPAALRDSPPLFQTGFEISKCRSMTCTAVNRPPTFTSFCSNAVHLGEGLAPRGVRWATRLGGPNPLTSSIAFRSNPKNRAAEEIFFVKQIYRKP